MERDKSELPEASGGATPEPALEDLEPTSEQAAEVAGGMIPPRYSDRWWNNFISACSC